MKRTKAGRLLSFLMSVLLVISAAVPVQAATARATTMKLEKTVGSVSVKTQSGSARKISEGMRLYNGNTVKTAKASYAYISLDSSKAVKLDEKSKTTLRQKNKKLELLLKSGKLFFNVSTKLKDDESMNVRTSTMVTGVRGTCGVVENISSDSSKLYLLEGQVSLGGKNPVTVHGGQVATVQASASGDIAVETMKEADIPKFAIEEVLKDPALQKRIEDTTDLSVEKMEQYLNSESDASEEEKPEEPSVPVVPSEPSGPSNTNPSNPSNPDTSKPEEKVPTKVEVTGTNGTAQNLQDALDNGDIVTIATNAKVRVNAGETITVGQDKKLVIGSGATLYLASGSCLQIQGKEGLQLDGTIEGSSGYGTIQLGSSDGAVKGEILINTSGAIRAEQINLNNATLENHGLIDIGSMENKGQAEIVNGGLIKLKNAYTNTGAAIGTYTGTKTGVLISNDKSTAMPEDACMAQAVNNGTVSVIKERWFYATHLNATMEKYMSVGQDDGFVREDTDWSFCRDVVVDGDITLSDMRATLNEHSIQIESGNSLTLTNAGEITGHGEALIKMKGGTLTLDATGNAGNAGTAATSRCLNNSNSTGYVIAVEQPSTLNWTDKDLVLQSQGSLGQIIQGLDISNPDQCAWVNTSGYSIVGQDKDVGSILQLNASTP